MSSRRPDAAKGARRRVTPQSAVVGYRTAADGLEVLLVTSRIRGRWVLPKGTVEPGLTAAASAAKEAWEEAGVTGFVSADCLGVYRYVKTRRTGTQWCEVRVYPMRIKAVLPHWPEQRQRRRAWMPLDQAIVCVHEPTLRSLLAAFRARLAGRPCVTGDRRASPQGQPSRIGPAPWGPGLEQRRPLAISKST